MQRPSELYGRPWSEREYVIVLDAYFANKGKPRHENSPFVRELAAVLGRTPASVYMRMENFASVDPEEANHRKGLVRAAPLCAKVFNDWREKPDHLSSCAALLRSEAETPRSTQMLLFEPEPVKLPQAFGKYELLDPIGQGGFGSVFSCIHVETGAVGAIKIISTGNVYNHEATHRFMREIRALKTVVHPNVIRIREHNLDQETIFPAFVMDLAESNLTAFIKQQWQDQSTRPALETNEAATIVRSMAAALDALHSQSPRIIHRDLNPNNVLRLPDRTWVLADFGLAKFLDTVPFTTTFETSTRQGGWGAGYYGAPEQYRDFKHTNERTDIYALGILLWELFTTVGPPIERQHSGLGTSLECVFLKATERDPEARYTSVHEFAEAFDQAFS